MKYYLSQICEVGYEYKVKKTGKIDHQRDASGT